MDEWADGEEMGKERLRQDDSDWTSDRMER